MGIKLNLKIIDAKPKDKKIYYQIKKQTCEKFVNKYFGGWNKNEQIKYNNKIFKQSLEQTCFKVVKVNNKPVGFFGYSIFDKHIGCVTLQILDIEQRTSVFEHLLNKLVKLSDELSLPVYAKTFLDSTDIDLYKKSEFEIISTTSSHYILKKQNKENCMPRKQYEVFANEKFDGETKK